MRAVTSSWRSVRQSGTRLAKEMLLIALLRMAISKFVETERKLRAVSASGSAQVSLCTELADLPRNVVLEERGRSPAVDKPDARVRGQRSDHREERREQQHGQ